MTVEPITEVRTLWDCFDTTKLDSLLFVKKEIENRKPEQKRQRINKKFKTYVELVDEIYSKTIDLNIKIHSKGGVKTPKTLRKQLRLIERFLEKNRNKLTSFPYFCSDEENPIIVRYKIEIFIMKMAYDTLKAYYEKALSEAKNIS